MLRGFCKIWVAFIVLLLEATVADAYTIKYILNGGVNHPDNPTSYGNDATTTVRLEPATREGYSFLGWYIEACSACKSVYPNSDFDQFQGRGELSISVNLGDFTVSARWGLIPKVPQKDERGCYLVYTPEELYGLVKISSSGCVSLLNDIVVNKNLLDENGNLSTDDFVWWPLWGFSGTFEGNGHFISGLRGENGFISSLGFEDFYKGRSVVRNLGIKDSYFSADDAVGAIVGIVESPARLYNVYAEASVHGDWRVGGLVGIINATNDGCPTGPTSGNGKIDTTQVAIIENAYSLSYVEAGDAGLIFQEGGAGGITAEMDAAILRNVYFAGKMQGEKIDCIVPRHGFTCFDYEHVFEIENAVCMESKDTSVSKAMSLSQDQFSDGTVFDILSNGEKGYMWKQEVGVDDVPTFGDVKVGIHYVLNGGVNNDLNPLFFTMGDKSFTLMDPHKGNDVFEGWFQDRDFTQKVDSINAEDLNDRILYAKWKSYFVITLELDKSSSYNSSDYGIWKCYKPCRIKWSSDSSVFKLDKVYAQGYDFDGWFLDSIFSEQITEIPTENTEDITVYSKWKLSEFKVIYHLNGGINHPDNPTSFTILDFGKQLNEPSREGSVFYYWLDRRYTRSGPYNATYISTNPVEKLYKSEDTELYAGWSPIPQKPSQDSNGCYLISSKEELYWFANVVNGNDEDKKICASLQNDIVVNKDMIRESKLNLDTNECFYWAPIMNYAGVFQGNGYSISGLLTYDGVSLGGLFKSVSKEGSVENVEINSSYIYDYGIIDHLKIMIKDGVTTNPSFLNMKARHPWRMTINGHRATLSELLPQKQLLIMDAQGRILRKLQTEPSMTIDLPNAGKYVIWYENEARIVTIW